MTLEDDNHLAAWWLDLAPSRQEEALLSPDPPPIWLEMSIAEAGLDHATVAEFLHDKRNELEPTRDAGLNPRPGEAPG